MRSVSSAVIDLYIEETEMLYKNLWEQGISCRFFMFTRKVWDIFVFFSSNLCKEKAGR